MVDSVFTPGYQLLIAAIVDMRKQAGMTQRDLADALGREQSFVGRIETGQRRVDLVEFVWICRACGADPAVEVARLVKAIAAKAPRRRHK